ncbi:MAG: AarF/ABC1/UbiB kinase family protein [Saprospiraceae bacterium]|nr:AarF/ABC1/UbiB kinase family protein [Saprospiraceae bacterium]
MKTTDHIPVGKVRRAGKILPTGLKVGKNYLKHYGEKIVNPSLDRETLDESNASDIIKGLQELKGGGLKVAQMLSMEENLLPKAYVEQFSLAQFSVPPLSGPLVRRTFRKHLQHSPDEIFDTFDYKAKFAASIGQVHEAWLDGHRYAVKIQYPGVADSIQSDLALLKPMAGRILRMNMKDAQQYFDEVEDKLLEETDYVLELDQSQELTAHGRTHSDLVFPNYYPELSSSRILTMDWIEGIHLPEFMAATPTQSTCNRLAQDLWDFYMYQIHVLRKVHADPHPGNLLVTPDSRLALIDFGCIKSIPEDFYGPYFTLQDPAVRKDQSLLEQSLLELEILKEDDDPEEAAYFINLFGEILDQFLLPFESESFDFSDSSYFAKLSEMGEKLSRQTLKYRYNPNRGSRHFIYMNRTFFGLYHLMHQLKAEIKVDAGILATSS